MPMGPGKYDAECEGLIKSLSAETVILMVIGGNRGHGFSINSTDPMVVIRLPELMRRVADSIDKSLSDTPHEH